jgi:hypothetical protein
MWIGSCDVIISSTNLTHGRIVGSGWYCLVIEDVPLKELIKDSFKVKT